MNQVDLVIAVPFATPRFLRSHDYRNPAVHYLETDLSYEAQMVVGLMHTDLDYQKISLQPVVVHGKDVGVGGAVGSDTDTGACTKDVAVAEPVVVSAVALVLVEMKLP